jgi:histone acetyltransferase (RNA polymerase elongator complex component)
VRTIEIGTPTFNDRILALLNRGHDSEDSRNTVRIMKEEGFETGMQVMVGLPGETDADLRMNVAEILSLAPSFIRIYPLVVIEETPLFDQFRSGAYVPDTLETAVTKAAYVYSSAWAHGIATIKMGLTENEALRSRIAAGPYHPALGDLVKSETYRLALENKCGEIGAKGGVSVRIYPGDTPLLVGHRRSNIEKLQKGGISISWETDQALKKGHFVVEAGGRKALGDLSNALARIPF